MKNIIESLTRTPIAKGKTKAIYASIANPEHAFLIAQDDITAGNGAKHDVIPEKGRLANQTTCNVFIFLKTCGVPVAFEKQIHLEKFGKKVGFEAPLCQMCEYEVVIRREAHGSYLDRNPHFKKGHVFPKLILEYFLKTKDKKWVGKFSGTPYDLEEDDPLMEFDYPNKRIHLYYPGHTSEVRKTAHPGQLVGQKPFCTLPLNEFFSRDNEAELLKEMGTLAIRAFLLLEKAWQIQGRKIVDCKFEFGIDGNGTLRLADVVDNDSWRVVDGAGKYICKQSYRDGESLSEVAEKYRQVTELTGQFYLPTQRLIFWRGSDKDKFEALENASLELDLNVEVKEITCSAHKQPVQAYELLQQAVWEVPNTVVIALVGMSNGAGPTLSANTTAPVITVPAGYKEFPEDVWSSLRTPSNVPVMTVLSPANAVLAALQILALHNPRIYAELRIKQEKLLTN